MRGAQEAGRMFQGMQVVLGKGLRGLRKKDQPEMLGCGSNVKTDYASCIVWWGL